jgi:conjugative relaxase-like TrwC/TraI family protein
VLRIHKLTGGAKYYTTLAAKDLAAYYTGSGEAPGKWLGSGLSPLLFDLARQPNLPPDLQAILSEITTTDGSILDEKATKLFEFLNTQDAAKALFPPQRFQPDRAEGKWCSGYDLTFAAPKGLSLIATMTEDDGLRKAIYEAHEEAVQHTMSAIESDICYGREGKRGVRLVPGAGLIAAEFRHRTARPAIDGEVPDPHLHTHVVVANIVRHPDGSYGALDGRALTERGNALALAAGAMFATEQRLALEKRGIYLDWRTAGRNGLLEVDGIPADILKAFSSRHSQIEAELAQTGAISTAANNAAQRKTRHGKDQEAARATDAGLAEKLREKLARLTTDANKKARLAVLTDITSAVHDKPGKREESPSLDEIAMRLVAPVDISNPIAEPMPFHLTAMSPTFTLWDIAGAIARNAPTAAAGAVLQAARRLVASGQVIELERELASPDDEPASLLPWRRRYTTQEILDLERGVETRMSAGLCAGVGVGKTPNVEGLSRDQAAMCKRLVGSGNAVDMVVGDGGTGKTYALNRCREAWQKAGLPVIGCAKSAIAASELQAGSGIRSSTIDSLLAAIREDIQAKGAGLRRSAVVVVDEAAMAGTRELAELSSRVAAVNGKLVLVGDHRQFGAVDAGGLFGYLAVKTDPIHLTTNMRNPEQADMLRRLREGGNAPELVQNWRDNDMLHVLDRRVDAVLAMTQAWYIDQQAGKETAMLAYTNEDVGVLNAVARQMRLDAGEIQPGTQIGEREYSVGDKVVQLRNRTHAKTGTKSINSEVGTVTAIRRNSMVIMTRDGKKKLPFDYVKKHVTYAYARTAHKSQAATYDTVHALVSDNMYREGVYVEMSRPRETSHLYAVLPTDLTIDPEGTTHGHELDSASQDVEIDPDQVVTDYLARVLAKSGADQAAVSFDVSVTEIAEWQIGGRELRKIDTRLRTLATQIREAGGTAKDEAKQERDDLRERVDRHKYAVGLLASLATPPEIVERLGTPPILPDARARWRHQAAELITREAMWGNQDTYGNEAAKDWALHRTMQGDVA